MSEPNGETFARTPTRRNTPPGITPIRRIVTTDDAAGRGIALSDAPATDIHTDPARAGFAATRIWVTDSTPARARGVTDTLHLPDTLGPPPYGSVFRIFTYPPDDSWRGTVGSKEIAEFFREMGSPGASTYSARAPHPYMQKTGSLDFCIVLEGRIVLVLDEDEVHLEAGDVVVQCGTNHAWSNRSTESCTIAISMHDGGRAE
jgi:cupin domain